MGAWGINSLENDDGAGWFEEFFDEPSENLLFKAFASVNSFEDNYVEYTESAEALAAAEIVAALLGNPNSAFSSEDQERIRNFKLKPNAELVAAAQKAVERVKTNSELKELWDDSDDAAEWQATVENLFERLKQ